MNTAASAYSQYNNSKVMTASPAELILMLYDGAIKFSNLAVMGIEKGDVEKAHTNIVKTKNIIIELRSSLNFKYPVANDFDNVYKYVYQRLTEANIKKDKEIMEEVLTHLRTMRDTWKDVMKTSRAGTQE